MKHLKYLVVIVLAALILLPVLSACAPTPTVTPTPTPAVTEEIPQALIDAAKKEGKLVWYGTPGHKWADEIMKAFNERYPFIDIEYTQGIGPDLQERVVMEAEAGKYTVDFQQGISTYYSQMAEMGLFRDVSHLPFWEVYPETAKSPEGISFGMDMTYWILAYNPNLISAAEVPKTFDEIADPKWKGQFAIESRPTHWWLVIWVHWGPEKATAILEKVMANEPYVKSGYTAAAELMVAGEYKFMFPLQDYKIWEFGDRKAPIDWVPLELTPFHSQEAAIMKYAPHPNAAELWVRWLTSEEGQTVYNRVLHRGLPHPALAGKGPLGEFPDVEVGLLTVEHLELVAPDLPLMQTWNRLVHGM